MKIEMRTRGVTATKELKAHVQRRMRFALHRFGERVRRLHVLLEDINGPKGGIDIHCKLRVELAGGGDMVIHENHQDPFSAVSRASERISHAVGRRVDHLNTKRNGKIRRLKPLLHWRPRETDVPA